MLWWAAPALAGGLAFTAPHVYVSASTKIKCSYRHYNKRWQKQAFRPSSSVRQAHQVCNTWEAEEHERKDNRRSRTLPCQGSGGRAVGNKEAGTAQSDLTDDRTLQDLEGEIVGEGGGGGLREGPSNDD
eukprot:544285-Ditylum_brightwellii.AAC.2